MMIGVVLNLGASFMNSGAGSGAVDFFHGFQVALMMTVMTNLTQFVWSRCKASRTGTCWQVHRPTFLVLLSTILVNIQPMAILVIGSWKLCCAECTQLGLDASCTSTGYTYPPWAGGSPRECSAPGGNLFWDKSYCTGEKYAVFPTVLSGWLIQIFATWGGFAFMLVGVVEATQIIKKMGARWRAIRAGQGSARECNP